MPHEPRRHEAAVRAAHDADPVGVEIGLLESGVEEGEDVGAVAVAHVLADDPAMSRAVAGGAPRVAHDDCISR